MKSASTQSSAIYQGNVRHRRFGVKSNHFNYRIFMLALDLDELPDVAQNSRLFSLAKFNVMSFWQKDYVPGEPGNLKQRIKNKVEKLGGKRDIDRILFMGQTRSFGFYFSPANFYFCYDHDNECQSMLVEVSNTPWLERHYYLVDMQAQAPSKKDFHVSPFMDLDMTYQWKIQPPKNNVLIHIENHKQEKVFDATLSMKRVEFSASNLMRVWLSSPAMTFKVVAGIYWQALKLFTKRVPFVAHPNS